MRETPTKVDPAPPPTAAAKDKTAKEEWENEGGATRLGAPTQGVAAVELKPPGAHLAPSQIAAVDAIEDRLLIVESSDGAPPPRGWRLAGWHWLAIVVPVLLVLGGLIWVALAVGVGAALAGLALLAVMGAAASPVWGAGLLRGKEARAARVEAKAEVRAEAD